jgi:hypothetical protein
LRLFIASLVFMSLISLDVAQSEAADGAQIDTTSVLPPFDPTCLITTGSLVCVKPICAPNEVGLDGVGCLNPRCLIITCIDAIKLVEDLAEKTTRHTIVFEPLP